MYYNPLLNFIDVSLNFLYILKLHGIIHSMFNIKLSGFKELTDPKTGEKRTVELGTPRRIKIIYDNNMNSAYAVGRYKEMLEEVDIAPYWQYKTMADGRERLEHRALHNKVFKADDPFWDNFYPPNGWGCRCYVVNLTKRQVEKQGLKVENTIGGADNRIEDTAVTVNGEKRPAKTFVFEHNGRPVRMTPDAGWGGNQGLKTWGIDVIAWRKVENLPENIKYDFIAKMAENPHKKAVFENLIDKLIQNGFKSQKNEIALTWFYPNLFKKLEEVKIKSPIVVFQEKRVGHIIGDRNKLSPDELKEIYDILNNPDDIYYDYTQKEGINLAFTKDIPNSEKCIKACVKLGQKSKISGEIVNYVTTAGKVKKGEMNDKKSFKKIE